MDAHFKGLVPKLEKAAHLRETFLLCQERFKEILGLSLSTSLRKSLEALALELGKEQTKKWLELTTENTRLVLTIKPNSHPPVKLRSITKHFNALTEATDTLVSTALALREEIVEGSIARNIRWDSVNDPFAFFFFFNLFSSTDPLPKYRRPRAPLGPRFHLEKPKSFRRQSWASWTAGTLRATYFALDSRTTGS